MHSTLVNGNSIYLSTIFLASVQQASHLLQIPELILQPQRNYFLLPLLQKSPFYLVRFYLWVWPLVTWEINTGQAAEMVHSEQAWGIKKALFTEFILRYSTNKRISLLMTAWISVILLHCAQFSVRGKGYIYSIKAESFPFACLPSCQRQSLFSFYRQFEFSLVKQSFHSPPPLSKLSCWDVDEISWPPGDMWIHHYKKGIKDSHIWSHCIYQIKRMRQEHTLH